MMILNEIFISAFLCIAISQLPRSALANSNSPPAEDLQDEYYNIAPAMTDQFVPQDEKDAETIHASDFSKTTIAGILTHRERVRRYAINIKVADYLEEGQERWFTDNYKVEANLFNNLCYGLIEKESTVLSNYLNLFLNKKDKQIISIGIVLTKDTHDMITIFDNNYEKFNDQCGYLGKPYSIMIQNWSKKNRELLEKDELNHDNVAKDANTLNAEHNNGGWKTTRTQLECILFQKSIKYAKAVINEFQKLNKDKPIEDIISGSGLDESISKTYRNFAQYINNKHKFIAEILLRHSDGNDGWAVWIMCMAVIHPKEWSKVDEVFKQINKGIPLSKFITEKNIDKLLAEMMAVIIDPSFKPTKF